MIFLGITLRSLPLELVLECSCITPKDLRNWTLQCPNNLKKPRQHRRNMQNLEPIHDISRPAVVFSQHWCSTHAGAWCDLSLCEFLAHSAAVFGPRATYSNNDQQVMRDESVPRNAQKYIDVYIYIYIYVYVIVLYIIMYIYIYTWLYMYIHNSS